MISPLAVSRLQLMLAALLMSTTGAAIKSCDSFSSWQVACFRAGIAAVALILIVPNVRRSLNVRTVAVGCAYAGAAVLFVLATKLTTSANAIFLQSTSPITIVLLSIWLLKEPLRRRDALFMLALAAGLSLFFLGGHQATTSTPDPIKGNLFALMSGLFWALTVIGLRWLSHAGKNYGNEAAVAVISGCLVACAITLPMSLPIQQSHMADWLTVLYLGIFGVALVFLLVSKAMKQVTAIEAGLILLLEPALNPLWAWVLQGENPGVPALTGGAIILSATAIHTCWPNRPAISALV
ncbi:MAG: EamA family transporter [Desulfuromonadaceae bacterium]|nr:EamA family transporter [Desulfuromonadaceae bacterium]MDD5105104.1 EamA family transporter [Desulfuromonadaceae bacterium]